MLFRSNLVVNARDALPSGGHIIVSTSTVRREAPSSPSSSEPPAGDYVRLTVADDGSGMSPEILARIFDPFFTTKAPGFGTGLGLAAVHSIVQRHGAFVHVESRPGSGTTFFVDFPAASPDVSIPAPAAPTVARTAEPSAASLRVLLVEDDAQLRELLFRVLRDDGYRVLQADDGLAALEVLQSEGAVDLVISDLMMPRMGGAGLRDALAAMPNPPPLLVMSGYAGELGAAQTFDHILIKPFKPAELLVTVRRILTAARA